jgi:hypothetical protein
MARHFKIDFPTELLLFEFAGAISFTTIVYDLFSPFHLQCHPSRQKVYSFHLQTRGCGGGARPEPVFVNLLRTIGIDSQPGGPVRRLYLSYRPARLHGLAESLPRNRFLGSINDYKYGSAQDKEIAK